MKNVSKLLSLVIIVTLFFTSIPVEASVMNNKQNYQITKDTDDCKVVTSKTTDSTYVFTHNKKTNEITFSVYSNTNNELISSQTVDIDDYALYETESENSILAATTYQNTFSNWEYTITHGTTNLYQLRRPDGSLNGTYNFTTRMLAGYNKDYIDNFIDAVEAINTLEGQMVGALGLAVILAGVSIVLTGGAAGAFWGAYIASLTSDSAAVGLGFALDSECNKASANYWDTFYHQY